MNITSIKTPRLTRKESGHYAYENQIIVNGDAIGVHYEMGGHVDKLGELEDIEEELGIDVTILFKALKQRFVYCLHNGKICCMLVCIEYYKDIGFTIGSVSGDTYKIEDYGKTWAFTEEELKEKNFS